MRIHRDPNCTAISASSVVCIGNFDGVHSGHQALIRRCRQHLQAGQDLAVVTFDPLPRYFFDAQSAPARITGPAQRLALLSQYGVDLAWMMRFNARLAGMSAEQFVQRVIVDGLAATKVVVGEDFRFGKGRAGTLDLLRTLGAIHGFAVEAHEAVLLNGQRVSSTAIREALKLADFDAAAGMLGRRFSLCGRVIRGRQVGRQLGYPTANVRIWDGKCLTRGVFAVYARRRKGGKKGPWLPGVANLGMRPAVGGGEPLLEVHLFDFQDQLYGERLETRLVAKLRDEANFDSLGALKGKMIEDEKNARAILGT